MSAADSKAKPKAAKSKSKSGASASGSCDGGDGAAGGGGGAGGAVHGNFHNYYTFNPTVQRMASLPETLPLCCVPPQSTAGSGGAGAATKVFTYIDIGCNEGNLTIAMARRAHKVLSPFGYRIVALGIDIDPVLIERANSKRKGVSTPTSAAPATPAVAAASTGDAKANAAAATAASGDASASDNELSAAADGLDIRFVACSVMDEKSSVPVLDSFLSQSGSAAKRVDLISCFSTTMWLHLHNGDTGLHRFLTSFAMRYATHLLLEPQHWRSYQSCVRRWKRLTPPQPPPPHFATLKWKNDVVPAIHDILTAGLAVGQSPATATVTATAAPAAPAAATTASAVDTKQSPVTAASPPFVHTHSFGESEWGRLLWLFSHADSATAGAAAATVCCTGRTNCTKSATCAALLKPPPQQPPQQPTAKS